MIRRSPPSHRVRLARAAVSAGAAAFAYVTGLALRPGGHGESLSEAARSGFLLLHFVGVVLAAGLLSLLVTRNQPARDALVHVPIVVLGTVLYGGFSIVLSRILSDPPSDLQGAARLVFAIPIGALFAMFGAMVFFWGIALGATALTVADVLLLRRYLLSQRYFAAGAAAANGPGANDSPAT